MRAIAVFLVVGYHAFPGKIEGGFIGVDIFFVISGFLISTLIFENLQYGKFSFIEFYSRRIKRIFPSLLIVLTTCFFFGWIVLLPDEYKQLGKHISGGAGFISNLVLWSESGYFDKDAYTKPLLHLWSLGIEEQFYIAWPLLLWGAWKKNLNRLNMIILLATISFALNILEIRSEVITAFYSPQTRFWEFLVGALVAHLLLYEGHPQSFLHHKANESILHNACPVFGLLLIAVGTAQITNESLFPGMWALFPVLGSACIIAAGTKSWFNLKILSNRVLVWFGLISFPLYLWHWPLLSFARIIEDKIPSAYIRLAAVAMSIVLAWLTYELAEKPIRFGSPSKSKKTTMVLLVLMAAIGSAGYTVYLGNGLVSRFPQIAHELIQYKFDFRNAYRLHTCFLELNEDYSTFGDCGITRDKSKKTVFLWGDSHAAQLYAGYNEIFGKEFNIIQRTASACPPLIDINQINQMNSINQKYCRSINDNNLDVIKKEMPDRVVLSAFWFVYGGNWVHLAKTIAKLREIGISTIDLVGVDPYWNDPIPTLLYKAFMKDPLHKIPLRLNIATKNTLMLLDAQLEDFAKNQKINYISPIKLLCNENGCITRAGETIDSLIFWDYEHLTTVGSIYLVSKFPKN